MGDPDHPGCERSRPRQGRGHVSERQLMLRRLIVIRSAPVSGNSNRPGCGRSRPRQGRGHVSERQLMLGV